MQYLVEAYDKMHFFFHKNTTKDKIKLVQQCINHRTEEEMLQSFIIE